MTWAEVGYGKGLCVLANTDKSSKQKDILVLSDACESFSACQWTLSIRPKEISGSRRELRIKEESLEFSCITGKNGVLS